MAEHGLRYGRLARAMNRAGIIVWAHDHRGHGLNVSPGLLGHFADEDGWRALVDDAWAVSAEMRRTFTGLPLILFAHSMGSFVAQTLMAEQGSAYQAIVLSGTNGPPGAQEALVRGLARLQRRLRGARGPGTWVGDMVFGDYNRRFRPNRTAFDWLSRDEIEVDRYVEDPLCGFSLTAQSWLDFLRGRTVLGTEAHLQRIPKALPIRVIAGTQDPVGEQSQGVRRLLSVYAAAGLTRVSDRLYAEARHELVNETNREEVTRELIAWLESVLTA